MLLSNHCQVKVFRKSGVSFFGGANTKFFSDADLAHSGLPTTQYVVMCKVTIPLYLSMSRNVAHSFDLHAGVAIHSLTGEERRP